MVFGISTSGTSPNVLRGLTAARAAGAFTVGLTGQKGDSLGAYCDVVLAVPSPVTARIQEMHILLGHLFCSALEDELGFGGDTPDEPPGAVFLDRDGTLIVEKNYLSDPNEVELERGVDRRSCSCCKSVGRPLVVRDEPVGDRTRVLRSGRGDCGQRTHRC